MFKNTVSPYPSQDVHLLNRLTISQLRSIRCKWFLKFHLHRILHLNKAIFRWNPVGPKKQKARKQGVHELSNIINTLKSGGEENRTPVQTYSSKAFYMFICW